MCNVSCNQNISWCQEVLWCPGHTRSRLLSMGLSCVFLSYFGGGTDVREQIHSHFFIVSCSEIGVSQKIEEKTAKVDSCRVLREKDVKINMGRSSAHCCQAPLVHESPMKVPHLEPHRGEHHRSGDCVLPCCSKLLAGSYCRGHAVVSFAALRLRFFLLYTALTRGNKLLPQLLEFQHSPQRPLNSCLFWHLTVLVLPLYSPLISHTWVLFTFYSGNHTWNVFETCAPLNISISSPVPPFLSSPSFFVGLYSWGVCCPTATYSTSESSF